MNRDLPNLHDAVLESIEIDWQSATASLHLGLVGDPPPKLALVFGGVREVRVPNDQPWGPSVFVNAVERIDGGQAEGLSMRLEMQSGDEITIRAASLEIA